MPSSSLSSPPHSRAYSRLSRVAAHTFWHRPLTPPISFTTFMPTPSKGLPQGAADPGDGFILLRKRDRSNYTLQSTQESLTIQAFLGPTQPILPIQRWARLRLPNGQTARSLWRESLRVIHKRRVSCNVSFTPAAQGMTATSTPTRLGEVQYFTRLVYRCEDDTYVFRDVAIIKLYSEPQPELSLRTVTATCKLTSELSVIPVKSIHRVVTMIPRSFDTNGGIEERFCVLRQPGIDA